VRNTASVGVEQKISDTEGGFAEDLEDGDNFGVSVARIGDIDKDGIDRSGNPDFLTKDDPSPAGGFAYNTVLCNVQKTTLAHRPGWDNLATARSHVFRRDL